MTGIYSTPVLTVEQLSTQLEYRITDGQGTPVAAAAQVAGERPRKGLLGRFSSGVENERLVVQVSDPGGAPLFFVDRAPEAPVAVVAPDGTVIGRLAYDAQAFAQSYLAGQARTPGGRDRFNESHRLVDANDNTLCAVTWEETRMGGYVTDQPSGGRYCVFTDANGNELARMDQAQNKQVRDRYDLRLNYQLPEPLRTLVIASPIAFDLSRS